MFGSIIFHIILIAGAGTGMRQRPLDLDKTAYFQLVTDVQAEASPVLGRNGLKTTGSQGNSVSLQWHRAVRNSVEHMNPVPVERKPEAEKANEDIKPAVDNCTVLHGSKPETSPVGDQRNYPGTGPEGNATDGSGIPGNGPGVTPPRRIYAPEPEYPAIARRNNWEGLVTLRVLIKTDGAIGDITVFQSSGYEVLDQSALKTVKKWRYQPASRQGVAVECYWRIPVRFQLEE